MPLDDNDITLIEKYIDNALSQGEAELFNSRLKDQTFYDEFKLQEAVAGSLKVVYRKKLKDELKQRLPEIRNDVVPFRKRQYFYWAASVAVITVISLIFFFIQRQHSAGSVFVAMYKPYPAAPVTRGQAEVPEHPAFEMYRRGNYQEAATMFNQLISENNPAFNETLLQLLLGNCYLNTDHFDQAAICFKNVMDSRQGILEQHGKWYYALTLLKDNKIDQSVSVFTEIRDSESIYSHRAQEAIDQLL